MSVFYTIGGFEDYVSPQAAPVSGRWPKMRSWPSSLKGTWRLPPQSWWRRLLRLDRPAQKLYIGFQFKNAQWHAAEACLHAPKGTEVVEIEFTMLDGTPMELDPYTNSVCAIPQGKGK
jgi:hypothetical protein